MSEIEHNETYEVIKPTRKRVTRKPKVVEPVDEAPVKKVRKAKKVEVVEPLVAEAAKRTPSAYNMFISKHIKDADVQALPPKQRFGKLSEMYKASQKK